MNETSQKRLIDDCWNQIGVWSKSERTCPMLRDVIHCHNCSKYSIAGRTLLDREISDEYIAEWQASYQLEKPVVARSEEHTSELQSH